MSKKITGQAKKLIIIVGSTASGKSDLGVSMARKIRGEIISADSRQVYRGMDIGTGKVTPKEMRNVPHHLLDVASPKSDFNVSHFKRLAQKKIVEIARRGKVPIIVGGTGFWVDALIYDWPIPEIGPNRALRARLEKMTVEMLFAKLKKLDPDRADAINHHNKRRLIRALEITLTTGKKIPKLDLSFYHDRDKMPLIVRGLSFKVLLIGIKLSQKELEKRIYKRLIKRLKSGMIAETKRLHQSGVSWKRLDSFGLEYRFASRYLHSLLTYDQMVEQLYRAIKNYAKRQMRWFKRNKQIQWINNPKQAGRLVKKFI